MDIQSVSPPAQPEYRFTHDWNADDKGGRDIYADLVCGFGTLPD